MEDVLYKINLAKSFKDNILFNNPELEILLQSGDKIICYMQKSVCRSCIFKVLQDLGIMVENIGSGHVIFASDIGTNDHPFNIPEFDFPSIYIKTFNFPQEVISEPMVFVLDKYLNIKLFSLPNIFPELRQKYFNEILPDYYLASMS